MSMRSLCVGCGAMACIVAAIDMAPVNSASIAEWPEKAVRIIVPFGAGSADAAARIIAEGIRQRTGKVVVVEYWASWCPFCKNTMPHLQKFYDANKSKGLEVIVLSIDKTEREATDALRQRGFSFRAGMATEQTNRVFGRLRGLPVTYVIGRDGRLARQEMGELFAEDIAEFADFLKPAR